MHHRLTYGGTQSDADANLPPALPHGVGHQAINPDTGKRQRQNGKGPHHLSHDLVAGYFVFEESNKVDPKRVLKMIQGKPQEYRLDGPLKLRFTHDARTEEKLFTRVEQLVEHMT